MGIIMSQMGSVGLDGSDDEEVGLSKTRVELSQSSSILGEYAGVDGSESMKVPKLLADIGGDIGPGDLGLIESDLKDCEGKPSAEKR